MAKIVGGVTATPTPKVDAALDPNSANAVQNGAVARRVLSLENGAYQLSERMTAIEKDLDTVDELANSANELGATVAEVSTSMASLSTRVTDLTDDVDGHSEQIAEVSAAVENKQDVLVSGQNIKTVNGQSVLGEGNIDTSVPVDGALDANSVNPVQNKAVSAAVARIDNNVSSIGADVALLSAGIGQKQDALVSGTNIKTINGKSLLGSGDINIEAGTNITVDDAMSETSTNPVQNKVVKAAIDRATEDAATALGNLGSSVQSLSVGLGNKQDTLVSGTNIKTINGQSILGSGNITIDGGGGASITVDSVFSETSENPVQNKVITAVFNEAVGMLTSLQGQVENLPATIETYVEQYISEALGGEY